MTMNMSYGQYLIGTAKTGQTTVPGSPTVFGKGTMMVPASVTMGLPDKGAALTQLAQDIIHKQSVVLSINGATDTIAKSSALGYQMHVAGVPVKLPNPDA